MWHYTYFRIFLICSLLSIYGCLVGPKNLAALELLSRNTSVIVSTLSLQLSLSKLALFAQGDVKKELLTALGYKNDNQINQMYEGLEEYLLTKIDFIMFNRFYVNYTNDFKNSFLTTSFNTRVDKVSFNYPEAAAKFINKQVDAECYKRINDIIQKSDINNETSMILVNAAYIKPIWEVPFILRLTRYMKFRCYNGKVVSVPMMRKKDYVFYINDQTYNLEVLNLKLGSPGLSITFVLPSDTHQLTDFLNNSTRPLYLRDLSARMKMEAVDISIPRFKIKSAVDWTQRLQEIGLKKIFQKNNTDLNRILKDEIKKHMYLSSVKQKNFIEIEEMTPVIMGQESAPFKGERIDSRFSAQFVTDRPFYFSVNVHMDPADYHYTEQLFNGVYYGPD